MVGLAYRPSSSACPGPPSLGNYETQISTVDRIEYKHVLIGMEEWACCQLGGIQWAWTVHELSCDMLQLIDVWLQFRRCEVIQQCRKHDLHS